MQEPEMTVDKVKELVQVQARGDLQLTNDHRIALKQALVAPEKITLIERTVRSGKFKDRRIVVWLVGQEHSPDGYKIVMREDGFQFGLAARGFAVDRLRILTGWYGNLVSAFLAM